MNFGEHIRQETIRERRKQQEEAVEEAVEQANRQYAQGKPGATLRNCAISLARMGLLSNFREAINEFQSVDDTGDLQTWPFAVRSLWQDAVVPVLREEGQTRRMPLSDDEAVMTGINAADILEETPNLDSRINGHLLDEYQYARQMRSISRRAFEKCSLIKHRPKTFTEVVKGVLHTAETAATLRGIIDTDLKDTYRVEKDEFEDSWLYQEWERRVDNGQDMVVVITAAGERGVGKTVLALKLAEMFDRTGDGMGPRNVTTHPAELRDMYVDMPQGASLLLDEAAVAIGNRSAMTNQNRSIRDAMNQGRLEEKMLFICAPTSGHIDKFVSELAAVWIRVTDLGEAYVHEYDYQPYQEELFTPKRHQIKWWDLDTDQLEAAHDEISEQKRASIRGEGESDKKISASEVSAKLDQAREEATAETRDDLLCSIYDDTDLTQQQIGDAVGLSRSRVADILSK